MRWQPKTLDAMHKAMRETLENGEANVFKNPAHPYPWLKAKHFHRPTVNDSFHRAKTKCATWFRLLKTKSLSKKRSEKPTSGDKHGQTKTVGDQEGRRFETK